MTDNRRVLMELITQQSERIQALEATLDTALQLLQAGASKAKVAQHLADFLLDKQ